VKRAPDAAAAPAHRHPLPVDLAASLACSDADIDRALDRAQGTLASLLSQHLIAQLLLAARELDVDYESLVVLGVLALRDGPQARAAGTARTMGSARRGVRASDLAAITGIPRETVRRKLLALEQAGRVERMPLGWIARDGLLGPHQRAFARASVRGLLATVSGLVAALDAAREAADGAPDPTGTGTGSRGR
jgi:hypothetical protein